LALIGEAEIGGQPRDFLTSLGPEQISLESSAPR
jgi:hypothetical protein